MCLYTGEDIDIDTDKDINKFEQKNYIARKGFLATYSPFKINQIIYEIFFGIVVNKGDIIINTIIR